MWLIVAAALADPLAPPGTDRHAWEWDLPSGLVVIHAEDPRYPVARIVLTLPVGTGDAPAGKRQLAHLAEHLAFRTTLDGVEAQVALDAAGCSYNAGTWVDRTAFYFECPLDAVEVPFRLAMTLLGGSLPGLDDAVLAVEQQVVLHEAGQREEALGLPLYYAALRAVYAEDHPYDVEQHLPGDVTGVALPDVAAFARSRYAPGGAVLSVGGAIDAPTLAKLFTTWAGDGVAHPDQRRGEAQEWDDAAIPWFEQTTGRAWWFSDPADRTRPLGAGKPSAAVRREVDPPPPPGNQPITLSLPSQWPGAVVAWYLPAADRTTYWPLYHADRFATRDLSRAIGGFDALEEYGCASVPGQLGSLLYCYAFSRNPDDVGKLLDRIATAFGADYPLQRELALTPLDTTASWAGQKVLEHDAGGLWLLTELTAHRLATGLPDYEGTKYASVGGGKGLEAWLALSGRWLVPERAAAIAVEPAVREGTGAAANAAVALAEGAKIWPVPDLGFAAMGSAEEFTLSNGLHVVLLPAEGARRAYWSLVVPALPGDAAMAMLVDPSLDTPARVDGNEMRYRFASDLETGFTAFRFSTIGLWDPRLAARALWGTLQKPTPNGIGPRFGRITASTVRASRSPSFWMSTAWEQAVTSSGAVDLAALDAATEQAKDATVLEAYLATKFRPERSTLLLTGVWDPITKERLSDELEDWTAPPDPHWTGTPFVRKVPSPEILLFDTPVRETRAVVEWRCPLATAAPDSALLDVFRNYAGLRLTAAIRNTSGQTYTPIADVQRNLGAADLRLSAGTEGERSAVLLAAIRAVAADLAARPPSDAELAAARRLAASAELVRRASTYGLATSLELEIPRDGSLAPVARWTERVAAVEPAAVTALAATCATAGVALVSAPLAAEADLRTSGLAVRVIDWRAEHLALVEAFAPDRRKFETAWTDATRR
jgi:zinc protease